MDSDTRSVFEENDPDNGNMMGLNDIQNAYREADTVRLRPVIAAVVEKAMRDWSGPFRRRPPSPYVLAGHPNAIGDGPRRLEACLTVDSKRGSVTMRPRPMGGSSAAGILLPGGSRRLAPIGRTT